MPSKKDDTQSEREAGHQPKRFLALLGYRLKRMLASSARWKRSVDFDNLDIKEFVDFVGGITHRNKFTQEEKNEIQLKVELLYEKHVIQTQEEDAQLQKEVEERIDAALAKGLNVTPGHQPMTPEEWNKMHRLRANGKRIPGPQPKKKGTVLEAPAFAFRDTFKPLTNKEIDQLEMEWPMEKAKERADKSNQLLKGRRFRSDVENAMTRQHDSSLWH